jgi:anhydro-N-acetylmuramic acid kinase
MIVAGVMSGTSADGINVALVRFASVRRFKLLGHVEYAYPKPVRAAILAAMNAPSARVADLSRLNFLLGELYADAVRKAQKRFHIRANIVACHGQTLYHQGAPEGFLGRRVAATWQTGEAAIVAARLGIPVVSDFRPADIAAGGLGAPLVPFLDFALLRDWRVGRIVQNIGGIANLTAIPADAAAKDVLAFDTGPGNMVIDGVMSELFGQPYDRGGKIAASGSPLKDVLAKLLADRFFTRRPPKTAGREQFGDKFVKDFLRRCGRVRKQDIVATATALTARSIGQAIRKFVVTGKSGRFRDVIVSGGGTRNTTLMTMLRSEVSPLGLSVRTSDEFGLPSAAKEAVAFALLGYQTWHRRPSNVPSATGARRDAVLGKICYP